MRRSSPLGAIFGIWLLIIGAGLTLVALTGFVLEYYVNEPDVAPE